MLNKEYYKVYKFDYGNPFKCFLSYFIQFAANFSLMLLSFFASIYLASLIKYNMNIEVIKDFLYIILGIATVAWEIFLSVLGLLPKKVILTYNGIKIQRKAIPLAFFNGFNDFILYSAIELCRKTEYDSLKKRNDARFGNTLPFVAFSWDNLVKVRTNRQIYLIPVKNAEEFIADVNKRIQIRKDAQNDSNKNDRP